MSSFQFHNPFRWLFLAATMAVSAQARALAITPIDLNDFYSDPSVVVAGDGSSATLAEDALLSPVLLANDPGLGDPNVIIPDNNVWLAFDYMFDEPLGNDDELGVFL